MKLLAVGDIHLGRPPAALPADLVGRGRELGPEAAWRRAVAAAIERELDAVLLAGDVVDRGRDFFVAYGELKAGIEKLADANIPVIAVAGNHDTEILPRLASEIPALHLLGAGGRWEMHELERVAIVGWSFPTTHVYSSPLQSFEPPSTALPVIGLLHCDRDQPGSRYGPVTSNELEAAPTDAWLLGHIHQPDDLSGKRPVGYLGSVTALRASETGPRGPWLVEVRGRQVRAAQLPLAPLRYESLEVDVASLAAPDQLFAAILAAARDRIGALAQSGWVPDALGLRVVLTGPTRFGAELAAQADSLAEEARSFEESGVAVFIQKTELATLPETDLKGLAASPDPAGMLARDLLDLADPDSERRSELIEAARKELDPLVESREFRALEATLDDHRVAEILTRAGRVALSRLIAQHRPEK